MTRTELPTRYVDRLAELVMLHRREAVDATRADQSLIWDLPGIKSAISDVQDTGAQALDIVCVAVSAADDLSIRTPALMARSGRHWTYTTTGTPERPRCPHGMKVDKTPGSTTAAACEQCHPRYGRPKVDWRETYEKTRAETQQERRTREAQIAARQAAARLADQKRKNTQREQVLAELHPKD